jgi:hypothetical protein
VFFAHPAAVGDASAVVQVAGTAGI